MAGALIGNADARAHLDGLFAKLGVPEELQQLFGGSSGSSVLDSVKAAMSDPATLDALQTAASDPAALASLSSMLADLRGGGDRPPM